MLGNCGVGASRSIPLTVFFLPYRVRI